MKRLLSLTFTVLSMITLVGCSGTKEQTKVPVKKVEQQQVKLQDGFTVLLMTETKFGTILTLENNTNPFELLGNCRSCR